MSKYVHFVFLFFCPIYSCFAQINYNYITDFIDSIPPNTQEIIAWESEITEKGDTITSKSEYWQYDKNKNILLWAAPQSYCGIEQKYDKQNRIIRIEKMCGESSDNGVILISYPSKNIILEDHGKSGYSAFTQREFAYNQKGKLIREQVYDSIYNKIFEDENHYEIYNYVVVYKYDKNDNLIEKNTFTLPKLTTRETVSYTYNEYNQILSEETKYKYDDGGSSTSIIKYNYYGYLNKGEKKPNIFVINKTTISDYSTESRIEKYDYSQKNIIEIEISKTSSSFPKADIENYQLIYKDNKLIRKKYFSNTQKKQDRKVISWIDYQYIFY
jgi:hypothetical protein